MMTLENAFGYHFPTPPPPPSKMKLCRVPAAAEVSHPVGAGGTLTVPTRVLCLNQAKAKTCLKSGSS